uniref:Suppressor of cytokine signaling 1a n=1 Tax=Oryzias melastigma TaxID=30732 RepID=A0A3B3DW55_ORYME
MGQVTIRQRDCAQTALDSKYLHVTSSQMTLSASLTFSSSDHLFSNSAVEGHEKSHLPSSPPCTQSDGLQRRANPSPRSVHLTHFRTFTSREDCDTITDTAAKLERSGFYWGPLGVEDAHRMLQDAPLGSFLIRDSRQKNVFFTLSYNAKGGPVSVRIDYKQHKFSLAGSERSFLTLFALLEHYINSPKKSLSVPYRKWQPSLQELCRRRIVEMCGGKSHLTELPATHVVQDFLLEFPYKL